MTDTKGLKTVYLSRDCLIYLDTKKNVSAYVDELVKKDLQKVQNTNETLQEKINRIASVIAELYLKRAEIDKQIEENKKQQSELLEQHKLIKEDEMIVHQYESEDFFVKSNNWFNNNCIFETVPSEEDLVGYIKLYWSSTKYRLTVMPLAVQRRLMQQLKSYHWG